MNVEDLDYKNIIQVVKKERKKIGFTAEKLAEESDISLSWLKAMEAGYRQITFPTFIRLANGLEISPTVLMAELLGEDTEALRKFYRIIKDQPKEKVDKVLTAIEMLM